MVEFASVAGCPSDETLAELASGGLAGAQQASLSPHLESCERCKGVLAELLEATAEGVGASRPVDVPVFEPGAQVGRYLLLQRLGAGAMGVVFKAYDTRLERPVALKALHRSDGGPSLLDEARAMARLSHPNVVGVFEAFEWSGQVVLIMELVEGTSLREWLASPRKRAAVLRAFVEAADGLSAAHAAGVVHRDFKPDNVLMDVGGRARLTDFGLARARAGTAGPEIGASAAGALVGTPLYMAPEQLDGQTADARSDQFAFCASLWEALTGGPPFTGRTIQELKDARAARLPATLLPRRLERLLRRGLSVDPAARHPSMQAVHVELSRASSAPRRRAVAAGAVALVAIASAAWGAARPRSACEALRSRVATLLQAMPAAPPSFHALADAWSQAAARCDDGAVERVGCATEAVGELEIAAAALEGLDAEALARAPRLLQHVRPPSACERPVPFTGLAVPAPLQPEAARLTRKLLVAVTHHYAGRTEEAQAGLTEVEHAAAASKLSGLEARAQFERAALEAGLIRSAESLEWARRAETSATIAGAVREAAWAALAVRSLLCISSAGSKTECDEAGSRAERLVHRVDDAWLNNWLAEQRATQGHASLEEVHGAWRELAGAEPEQARCLRAGLASSDAAETPGARLARIDQFLGSGLERRPLILALVQLMRALPLEELQRPGEAELVMAQTEPLRRVSPVFDTLWRDTRSRLLMAREGPEGVLENTAGATGEYDRLLRLDALARLERWAEYDALDGALRDFGAASLSSAGAKSLARLRLHAELRRGNVDAARKLRGAAPGDEVVAFQLALEEGDDAALAGQLAAARGAARPTPGQQVVIIEGLIREARFVEARDAASALSASANQGEDPAVVHVLLSDALLLSKDLEAGCRAASEADLPDAHLSARQLKRSRDLRRACRP